MSGVLEAFLTKSDPKILIEVAEAKGSAPREQSAFMLISASASAGTIGGGQLEYMAIDHARAMLAGKRLPTTIDVPLGPAIGQCCGGRVKLAFHEVAEKMKQALLTRLANEREARPSVYVFGAGHVGHALAGALAPLPFNVTMVETRKAELEGLPDGVEARLTAMPESLVPEIASGSAILILTHDHALDFLIGAEALKRNDLAYVGMIGSATKRATFKNWLARQAPAADIGKLTLPVGGPLKDKRPEIIAALTVAEVIDALSTTNTRPKGVPRKYSAQIG